MRAKDEVRRIRAAAVARLVRAGAEPEGAAVAVLSIQEDAERLLGHLQGEQLDSRHLALVAAEWLDEGLRARLAAALPSAWSAVRPSCAALRSST